MASQPIYQFYAALEDYKPKIWRRFQVAGHITMARLGYIIMTLFEMQASHLFCFDVPYEENFKLRVGAYIDNDINQAAIKMFQEHPGIASLRIELPYEYDCPKFEGRVINALEIKLKHVLDSKNERMTLSYDYGDKWWIDLLLEDIIIDKELPGKELPRVLEGEGFGIIENCGGAFGLAEIEKAFGKKQGAQYEEYCAWLGRDDLDLRAFDKDDMNYRLKKVPRIYADIYEYDLEPTKQSLDLLERRYMKK